MIQGYNNRGLELDLSTGKFTDFEIQDSIFENYLGGRGIGTYFLKKMLSPMTDPLSEDNLLIISTGGLSGSLAPAGGRFSVTFKSPLTGTISSANSGGFWGNSFKRTGFDLCIIRGKAAVPVYLYISEKRVEIIECKELWGKAIPELTDLLISSFSKSARVLAIGTAGERQVRFASIMNEYNRAVGRGGAGAVMGSKNLKAILVEGKKRFHPENEKLYKTGLYQANKMVKNFPITSKALTELGTPGLVKLIHAHDMLPHWNFRDVRHSAEDVERISGENLRLKIFKTAKGCYNCTIRCGRATKVGNKKGEGPEYETIALMGANLGIYNIERIALAGYLCNETGMDTISFGGSLAIAMELFQKGIINTDITGGLELNFGRAEILEKLVKLTAEREGFGDIIAEGALRMGQKYHAQELAMVTKGLEFPGYDPRASLLQALGYATSPRGGCHLKGGYAICLGFFGGTREVHRFLVDTAAGHSVEAQDSGCITDALGVCRFTSYSFGESELSRIYSGYTGLEFGPEDLKDAARRIQNLERVFNNQAGFSKQDDTLPKRMFTEKINIGGRGRAIDEEQQFKKMLDKYYEIRGWDKNGVPVNFKDY
jgi:aldehyde:ferredoxin oxidoreductase